MGSGATPVHQYWSAQIHANGQTIDPLKVMSIDITQDYEQNYSDEIILTVMLSAGVYASDIYPYLKFLEITLTQTPTFEVEGSPDPEQAPKSERFSAVLLDEAGNPILEGNLQGGATKQNLDLSALFPISFQLINKNLDQLRMASVGGIFRQTTGEKVVKALLTQESQKVEIDENQKILGVDMVPANNQKVRDHVLIPQGTKLMNLPAFIQNKCGGLYSSGIGYYLQGRYWYLYPCYDTSRFENAKSTLTVINVPKNKLPGIERTYRKDGSNLTVLATGDVSIKNPSESLQLSLGNGVRFSDASQFMDGFVSTKNNRSLASRGKTNSEVVSQRRASGNNNVHLSDQPINANAYAEYSKLAPRSGFIIGLTWENSNPSLLIPGMPIQLLYLDEDLIQTVYGVLLKAHHFIQPKGQAMMAGQHITNSALAFFVKPAD